MKKLALLGLAAVALAQQVDWNTQVYNKPFTSIQGNGSKVQFASGTPVSGDCVKYDSSGNVTDAGSACSSGAGLWYVSSVYNFAPQTPGGSLSSGTPATITLSPVPLGVNGTDSNHYVWISGGTGTAEGCLITGGTAVSGAGTGTITCTPANNHSGAWTVSSSAAGIPEAAQIITTAGAEASIFVPDGSWTINSPVTMGTNVCGLMGASQGARLSVTFLTGDVFTAANGSCYFHFAHLNPYSSSARTSGDLIHFTVSGAYVEDVYIDNMYNGVEIGVSSELHVAHSVIWATNWAVNSQSPVFIDHVHALSRAANCGAAPAGSASVRLNGDNGGGAIVGLEHDSGCTQYGIYMTATGDITVADSYIDNFYGNGFWADNGTNVTVANSKFVANGAGTAIGMHISNTSLNVKITGNKIGFNCNNGGYYGILLDGGASGPATIGINDNNIYGAGASCSMSPAPAIHLAGTGGGLIDVNITGNVLGYSYSENVAVTDGITIDSGAGSKFTIVGNTIDVATSPILFAGTIPSGLVLKNNTGVDNVVPAVASAATLTFPVNPSFTITGTTGVTAVAGLWAGAAGTFITTSGAVAFSSGATIGNSCTTTQNKPYTWTFDGTHLWINGSGC